MGNDQNRLISFCIRAPTPTCAGTWRTRHAPKRRFSDAPFSRCVFAVLVFLVLFSVPFDPKLRFARLDEFSSLSPNPLAVRRPQAQSARGTGAGAHPAATHPDAGVGRRQARTDGAGDAWCVLRLIIARCLMISPLPWPVSEIHPRWDAMSPFSTRTC